ncbi:MAG: TIGR02300 family protein [Marinicaulis sp.]|nr:TIGR02300 family protein [Marinicaulis sp.]NNE40759.1 TIGR02300 family protein [Marinicaulis sp.]NNL89311.1 TIGR02300 family protein [Marinicaulis sp.]
MSKPELGEKRDCPECGARFYDLTKSPAHCPKCHHEFVPEPLLKPRKTARDDEAAKDADTTEKKPEAEASLEDADKEKKAPKSNKRPALDDDSDDDDDDEDDELSDIDDIDVDLDDDDDEDDDSLLEDDDDSDVSSIIKPAKDDD